jgi:hypothetical protein
MRHQQIFSTSFAWPPVLPDRPDIGNVRIAVPSCDAAGGNICGTCGGKGSRMEQVQRVDNCSQCGGSGQRRMGKTMVTCGACGGKGGVTRTQHVQTPCRSCGGSGRR